MALPVTVEMGETGVSRAAGPDLEACGLGSCVGLCLYESAARVAVLVHVVLPHTPPPCGPAGRAAFIPPPGKCADTALAHALAEVARHGGQAAQVRAALVGGAQIFAGGGPQTPAASRLEIGGRNVRALKEELSRAGIPVCGEDTGGHFGRTIRLEPATGAVWVRPVGRAERLLTTLAPAPSGQAAPPALAAAGCAREGAWAYGV
jgi:chemotaxis protein CheD